MLRAIHAACLVGVAAIASVLPHAARGENADLCAVAGAEAERRAQLPPGLLLAIGRVESGRRNPASGQMAPWPWTINAAGAGHYFGDRDAALAATRASLAQGIASIDIGCFQINLQSHPNAFASLEEGFDPSANAHYAASFLTALHERLGSWEAAIAAYHSSTPERGAPYRDQVLAVWDQKAPVIQSVASPILFWTPAPGGVKIWTPHGGAAPTVIRFTGVPGLPVVHTPRG